MLHVQAVAAISLSKALQKECKGLISTITQMLEPQLDLCRYPLLPCQICMSLPHLLPSLSFWPSCDTQCIDRGRS